jgi:hypothetical protein
MWIEPVSVSKTAQNLKIYVETGEYWLHAGSQSRPKISTEQAWEQHAPD